MECEVVKVATRGPAHVPRPIASAARSEPLTSPSCRVMVMLAMVTLPPGVRESRECIERNGWMQYSVAPHALTTDVMTPIPAEDDTRQVGGAR